MVSYIAQQLHTAKRDASKEFERIQRRKNLDNAKNASDSNSNSRSPINNYKKIDDQYYSSSGLIRRKSAGHLEGRKQLSHRHQDQSSLVGHPLGQSLASFNNSSSCIVTDRLTSYNKVQLSHSKQTKMPVVAQLPRSNKHNNTGTYQINRIGDLGGIMKNNSYTFSALDTSITPI